MVIGAIVTALGPIGVTTGVQARGGPLQTPFQRAPGISPGDVIRASLATQALSERGLIPVVSTDPFTGNLVVSTQDQSENLFNLLGERFAREAFRSTPSESAEIFAERQAFIQSRRLNPVFPVGVDPPTAEVRAAIVGDLSRVSPTVIAPGVVSSARPSAMTRRLGGPCAGVTTGFQRLNCARGGIS